MENYDQAYSTTTALFGAEPEEMLVRFADLLNPSTRVLDVGCGQGRNALWLAGRGLEVTALDPSDEALDQVRRTAAERGLKLRTLKGEFADLRPDAGEFREPFAGLCVFGLLQILPPAGVEELRSTIEALTTRGSLLFLTAWTTDDPRFPEISSSWRALGPGSFAHDDGRIRTFFEPGGILDLFPSWEVIHHREVLGPWHRHGNSPKERHSVVEFVVRRRE